MKLTTRKLWTVRVLLILALCASFARICWVSFRASVWAFFALVVVGVLARLDNEVPDDEPRV